MDRPNIILVVLDSLRADRLSCYGYRRPTSPNIDLLGRESMLYEQSIATSCWTVPTHASIFTGMHPSEHGACDRVLPEETGPTLAEYLSRLGYATFLLSNNAFISARYGFARGFQTVREIWQERPRLRSGHVIGRLKKALGTGDRGASRTMWHLRRLGLADHQPFFLFINYMETHAPYMRVWPGFARFPQTWKHMARMPHIARIPRERRCLALDGRGREAELAALNALYDEHVALADVHTGRLVDWLEGSKLLDASFFVLTSDHGENLGDHGFVNHHFSLHDSLVRVPMVVRCPSRNAAGIRTSRQVQSSDIYASVAQLLGASLPQHLAASDPKPSSIFEPGDDAQDSPAYCEYFVPSWREVHPGERERIRPWWQPQRALRRNGLKLIVRESGDASLYNLAIDPGEEKDVSGTEGDSVRELVREIDARAARGSAKIVVDATREDAETERHLRGLGYL